MQIFYQSRAEKIDCDLQKNVIITGGAGYIGSHACKALHNAGYRPITVDNLSTGWSEAVKFGPFDGVDFLDRDKLIQVFKKHQPCAVMYFAAFSQVGESEDELAQWIRKNLEEIKS